MRMSLASLAASLVVSTLGVLLPSSGNAAVIVAFTDRGDGGLRATLTGTSVVTQIGFGIQPLRIGVSPGFLPADTGDFAGFPAASASGFLSNDTTATTFAADAGVSFVQDLVGTDVLALGVTPGFTASIGDVVTFSAMYDFAPTGSVTFANAIQGVYAFSFTDSNSFFDASDFTAVVGATSVPEPSSVALLGLGILGLIGARRRARAG